MNDINQVFTWANLAFALLTGIVTSGIFLVMTYLLRPTFSISPCIAKKTVNGKDMYKFKVVNRSFFFKIVDVTVELCLLEYSNVSGGRNTNIKRLPMIKDHIWFISPRKPFWQKDETAPFAILFSTDQNLEQGLTKDNVIHFKIIARHGLSGFPKVKTMKYFAQDCIHTGDFRFGNCMDVKAT